MACSADSHYTAPAAYALDGLCNRNHTVEHADEQLACVRGQQFVGDVPLTSPAARCRNDLQDAARRRIKTVGERHLERFTKPW